ncbi:hypothetical protein MAR_032593 [Mya arenaria]|uniref:Uncharacterized protein n=1 Tax=Mya arenaria TaxID=6604 RepID=A0ABY7F9G5_MYAAR|nr:hypothetical protein MAR_032593 [Mya arenaria]
MDIPWFETSIATPYATINHEINTMSSQRMTLLCTVLILSYAVQCLSLPTKTYATQTDVVNNKFGMRAGRYPNNEAPQNTATIKRDFIISYIGLGGGGRR